MLDQYSRFIYLHVGKTGGTSLRNILEEALGDGSCSPPFIQTRMSEQEALEHEKYKVICGHVSRFDHLKWFKFRPHIITLRDPIERGISFLSYVRSLPPNSCQVANDSRNLSLSDFLKTREVQINLNNAMVRQLGNHILEFDVSMPEIIDRAKETIRSAMWFGFQESLNNDLISLSELIGVPLSTKKLNESSDAWFHESEEDELRSYLEFSSKWDISLYRWALGIKPATGGGVLSSLPDS